MDWTRFEVQGLASTHNGEPCAGAVTGERRRGRGNRRRRGTRLWRFLRRQSRRCAGGQKEEKRAQVQAGRGDQRRAVQASTVVLFANRRAAGARVPDASPRPRHPVAPAPTSVDGTLPPTLGPAPDNQCHNQRLDPGAEPDPPPPRHPSTWLALARPCRALRSASPGSPPRVRPNGVFVE